VFLALLLLAFLKPVVQTHSLSADERGESRHAVVLVLDASASMGYAQGGSSPFARARLAGEKILDELHETDVADLVMAAPAPARGEEVEVSCKVANYTRLAKSAPVQLKFGGEKPMQHELDVPAETTASVTFRLRANRAGFFEGELTIPEDSLPVDNRRYFT